MCVARCPPSLIKMNVMQTTGKHSLVRKQAEGEKVKQQTRLLTPAHAMKLPSGSGRTEWKLNMHFASWYLLQCTKDKRLCCVFWTVVMALIRSRHKGASSVFMCGWCVRWNQSRPGCATRKVLVECTTPHCSYPPTPPALCAQPMSQSALDDGALSFRVERALKVRVGQRPSSLILAGFCHLVQQDKWTFDTQSDHTPAPALINTCLFALSHLLKPSCGRCCESQQIKHIHFLNGSW